MKPAGAPGRRRSTGNVAQVTEKVTSRVSTENVAVPAKVPNSASTRATEAFAMIEI